MVTSMTTVILWLMFINGAIWALSSPALDRVYSCLKDHAPPLNSLLTCNRCTGFWVGAISSYAFYFLPGCALFCVCPMEGFTWLSRIPVSVLLGFVSIGMVDLVNRFQRDY